MAQRELMSAINRVVALMSGWWESLEVVVSGWNAYIPVNSSADPLQFGVEILPTVDGMQKQFRDFLLQLWKVHLQHEIVHNRTRRSS